ncbi:hypothetical protein K2173_009584 [Erythroxylum novogranatense]|uniref:Uncharacterized protein n=1 Tax=Erythroxylum novogranatense TaxID=1862640 RepID=A0AAV8U8I8_9ROSI|nr:hypothetical protein K2173_009584 [Erythroxylum novogranatense]
MGLSSWLCSRSSSDMMVTIVYPGGHIELLDSPILAAEIMLRNPKFTVAYPHVFKDPWAVVSPDTTLMLGQKFYVVPISTIRKIQRKHLRYSASPNIDYSSLCTTNKDVESEDEASSNFCSISTKNIKNSIGCLYCFTFLKTKDSGDDASEVIRSSDSPGTSSETIELMRKRSKDAPRRFSSYYFWQPRLERINEE